MGELIFSLISMFIYSKLIFKNIEICSFVEVNTPTLKRRMQYYLASSFFSNQKLTSLNVLQLQSNMS